MIIDLHNDTALKLYAHNYSLKKGHPQLHIDIPKLLKSKAHIDILFFAIWYDSALFKGKAAKEITMELISFFKNKLQEVNVNDEIELAINFNDIDKILQKNKRVAIMTIEGGNALDNNLDNISFFSQMGIRLLTLTHFQSTDWASSNLAYADNDFGLTSFGKEVIRELENQKIIVDVSHTSTKTMLDVAKIAKAPIVYSHGMIRKLSNNSRGIEDDAIKAIADTGGVVGIFIVPGHPFFTSSELQNKIKQLEKSIEEDASLNIKEKFLKKIDRFCNENNTLFEFPAMNGMEQLFQNIDYVVNLVGDDYVALGSDFDGISFTYDDLRDISSFGDIKDYMQMKGYSKARIDKIMGGNALRVINTINKL